MVPPYRRHPITLLFCVLGTLIAAERQVWCQEQGKEPVSEKRGWSNSTDLGLAVTEGNSNTESFNFSSTTTRHWERARFRLKMDGVRSSSADDPFRQVVPGVTWLPGGEPAPAATTLVQPSEEPSTEQFYFEARYDNSTKRRLLLKPRSMTWHAGVSWDRNVQAGILSRSVAFAGVGHVWWARKDLKFDTSYGLSWTDRTEEIQDPEKEDRFPGVRFSWNYTNRWGKFVTYKNDWSFNISLSDISDYSSTMSQSVAVPMSSHLALKVSLQWKYNSEPALEDVSVLAQVVVVDPDGIPGSGDEFFETVESGGTTIDLGCVPKPNEPLDTVFTSSLTISF